MKAKLWQYTKLSEDISEILRSLTPYLETSQIDEVKHFIDHGEYGEALRTLGWLLVEENKKIDVTILRSIEQAANAMGMQEELPIALRHVKQ